MLDIHTRILVTCNDTVAWEDCEPFPIRWLATTSNLISIALNIVHIIILMSMEQKFKGYKRVLVCMSAGDIAVGLASCLFYSCEIRGWLIGVPNVLQHVSISVLMEGSNTMVYYLLALATYERFVGVCKPFTYSTNVIIKHIGRASLIISASCLVFSAVKMILMYEELCVTTGFLSPGKYSLANHISLCAVLILPSLVTIVLLIKTNQELRTMRRRSHQTFDKELVRASSYITRVSVAFYLCLIPVIPFIVLILVRNSLNGSVVEELIKWITVAYRINIFTHALYGIINVIIYGLMTPKYRKKIKKNVDSCIKHIRCISASQTYPVQDVQRDA